MKRGTPRKNGSGGGVRLNRGGGGCSPTRAVGRGRNKKR